MTAPNWSRVTDEFPRLSHDLQMIDRDLELRFNFLRARYEVWHPVKGLIFRAETKAGDFVAPGEWLVLTISGRSVSPPVDLRRMHELEREAVGREEIAKRRRDSLSDAPGVLTAH